MGNNIEKIGNQPFADTFCSKLWFPESLKILGEAVNYVGTEYIYKGPDAVGDEFVSKRVYADIYYDKSMEEWKQIEGSSNYSNINYNSCSDFEKHVYQKNIQPATQTKDGQINNFCKRCNKSDIVVIPKIEKVTLSAANYVYNGKVKTPTVTVQDSNATKLKKEQTIVYHMPVVERM